MGDNDDRIFMKRFGGIIAGLVIVTILIIIIATFREKTPDPTDNPSRIALAEERIAPVGAVRTKLPEPPVEPADSTPAETAGGGESPVGTVADGGAGDIDGEAVYAAACQACHLSGAAGAPIPGGDGWAERAAKGADVLAAGAIGGIGMMPPKGGRMDFSDDEVRAAVEHMLEQ